MAAFALVAWGRPHLSAGAPADPPALLRAIARELTRNGRRLVAGEEVDLDPLFAPLFLGNEITRLEAVVGQAERSLGWLERVPGPGRRYRLTAAGVAASARPADSPRRTLLLVVGAAVAAVLVMWWLLL